MTDHCQFRNCFRPEGIGCHAGELDHKKCHHWQIGQLRNECQKTREILLALAGVEDVRADVPGMLSVLYRMQQSVNPADGPSIAVTIRVLEFLRDTEPAQTDGPPDTADEVVGVGERVRADFLKSVPVHG